MLLTIPARRAAGPRGARLGARRRSTSPSAGDQNMVDYVKDYLGPMFEKAHPGVKVVSVGTGPGDAGSQKIYEKLDAQKGAGTTDFDVVVIHQKAAGAMVKEGLLAKYTDQVDTAKLVSERRRRRTRSAPTSRLRHADVPVQTALAYNADMLKNPPEKVRRAEGMGEEEPEAVRLQRHQGRHVRRRLRRRLGLCLRRRRRQADPGAVRPGREGQVGQAFAEMKDFNKNVVITPGNAGTLDMLNRGEIAMGPVWVDMFYSWQADGKLPPNMKLKLASPGMPGQPMYYAVPEKAAQRKLAEEFIALATSPQVQADGIVKKFNWYPGIDAKNLEGKLDKAAWDKLFTDITPADLAKNGKPFPIAPYFNDILEGYEKKVAN